MADRARSSVHADDSPLGFHLTREGGHGQRRIIHAADATGTAVQQTLTEQVKNHPNITVLERHIAVDLITAAKLGLPRNRCLGAYVLDIARDRVLTLGASHTALATGGAGKVYLYTTNPTRPPATAWRSRGAPAAAWPTWSSSSSTRPASTIRTPSPS
jgi:L-aspartate oxidase